MYSCVISIVLPLFYYALINIIGLSIHISSISTFKRERAISYMTRGYSHCICVTVSVYCNTKLWHGGCCLGHNYYNPKPIWSTVWYITTHLTRESKEKKMNYFFSNLLYEQITFLWKLVSRWVFFFLLVLFFYPQSVSFFHNENHINMKVKLIVVGKSKTFPQDHFLF